MLRVALGNLGITAPAGVTLLGALVLSLLEPGTWGAAVLRLALTVSTVITLGGNGIRHVSRRGSGPGYLAQWPDITGAMAAVLLATLNFVGLLLAGGAFPLLAVLVHMGLGALAIQPEAVALQRWLQSSPGSVDSATVGSGTQRATPGAAVDTATAETRCGQPAQLHRVAPRGAGHSIHAPLPDDSQCGSVCSTLAFQLPLRALSAPPALSMPPPPVPGSGGGSSLELPPALRSRSGVVPAPASKCFALAPNPAADVTTTRLLPGRIHTLAVAASHKSAAAVAIRKGAVAAAAKPAAGASAGSLKAPMGLSRCTIIEDAPFPPPNTTVTVMELQERCVRVGSRMLRYRSFRPTDYHCMPRAGTPASAAAVAGAAQPCMPPSCTYGTKLHLKVPWASPLDLGQPTNLLERLNAALSAGSGYMVVGATVRSGCIQLSLDLLPMAVADEGMDGAAGGQALGLPPAGTELSPQQFGELVAQMGLQPPDGAIVTVQYSRAELQRMQWSAAAQAWQPAGSAWASSRSSSGGSDGASPPLPVPCYTVCMQPAVTLVAACVGSCQPTVVRVPATLPQAVEHQLQGVCSSRQSGSRQPQAAPWQLVARCLGRALPVRLTRVTRAAESHVGECFQTASSLTTAAGQSAGLACHMEVEVLGLQPLLAESGTGIVVVQLELWHGAREVASGPVMVVAADAVRTAADSTDELTADLATLIADADVEDACDFIQDLGVFMQYVGAQLCDLLLQGPATAPGAGAGGSSSTTLELQQPGEVSAEAGTEAVLLPGSLDLSGQLRSLFQVGGARQHDVMLLIGIGLVSHSLRQGLPALASRLWRAFEALGYSFVELDAAVAGNSDVHMGLLHHAVASGEPRCVDAVLAWATASGADPGWQWTDRHGQTPLALAAACGATMLGHMQAEAEAAAEAAAVSDNDASAGRDQAELVLPSTPPALPLGAGVQAGTSLRATAAACRWPSNGFGGSGSQHAAAAGSGSETGAGRRGFLLSCLLGFSPPTMEAAYLEYAKRKHATTTWVWAPLMTAILVAALARSIKSGSFSEFPAALAFAWPYPVVVAGLLAAPRFTHRHITACWVLCSLARASNKFMCSLGVVRMPPSVVVFTQKGVTLLTDAAFPGLCERVPAAVEVPLRLVDLLGSAALYLHAGLADSALDALGQAALKVGCSLAARAAMELYLRLSFAACWRHGKAKAE